MCLCAIQVSYHEQMTKKSDISPVDLISEPLSRRPQHLLHPAAEGFTCTQIGYNGLFLKHCMIMMLCKATAGPSDGHGVVFGGFGFPVIIYYKTDLLLWEQQG